MPGPRKYWVTHLERARQVLRTFEDRQVGLVDGIVVWGERTYCLVSEDGVLWICEVSVITLGLS